MAINPMQLMKLKDRYKVFKETHPKVMPFLKSCKPLIDAGTALELRVKSPEGEEKAISIKLKAEDMKTVDMILSALGKKK